MTYKLLVAYEMRVLHIWEDTAQSYMNTQPLFPLSCLEKAATSTHSPFVLLNISINTPLLVSLSVQNCDQGLILQR